MGVAIVTKLDRGVGLVRGDIFSLRRTLNGLLGRTVDEAWLMVKTGYGVADGSATISKNITGTDAPGTGQIEDSGATDGSAVVRFDFTNTNTTAVAAGTVYLYGIQALLSDGQVLELETGTAVWRDQVVQDT